MRFTSFLVFGLCVFAGAAEATEFDWRVKQREEFYRQLNRERDLRELEETAKLWVPAIAESLRVSPESIVVQGPSNWATSDRRFLCQVASAMGGNYIKCVDERGEHVASVSSISEEKRAPRRARRH